MAEKLLQATIRLLGRQAMRQFSDADLLHRFTTTRDEAAFAALVDRHGGLVLRLCRRLFPHIQDAEDCFQATFILLAEKAGTIRKTQAVSSWLYGATQRVAMNAKRQAARRRKHEQGAAASQPSSRSGQPSEIASLRELQALLDAEVANLPEKYRDPFVLCCLEGKSGQDAARELGCKEGTVTARITQARHLLRRRLARRGVTLSAALTAAFIAPSAAVAVPRPLATATLEAALRYALNQSTAAIPSAAVAALVKGASDAILLSKIKTVTLLLLLVATGTGLAAIGYETMARREENIRESLLTPALPEEPASGMTKRARVDLYGDPLPAGALARLGTLRFRQKCAIGPFAFLPDSQIVVTGENNWINFWNLATGKIIRRLDASRSIEGLALSPDGKLLAVGNDGIRLFDLTTGRQRCQFGEGTRASSLVFSPDGKTLASCAGFGGPLPRTDTAIQLWDVSTGKKRVCLSGHTDVVNLPSFSPDGKILASTSWGDPAILLWDTATGKEIRQLKHADKNMGPVPLYVAFSPDGKLLTSTDPYNNTICFWDTRTYRVIRRIENVHDVQGICFSPDSRTLAVEGKRLLLYDTASGNRVCELNGYSDTDPIKPIQSYPSLRFSPNGKFLAVSTFYSNTLYLWDLTTGKRLLSFEGHRMPIQSIVFSPDHKSLATNTLEYEIYWWNRGAVRGDITPSHKNNSGGRVALSTDGKLLAKESISEVILCDAATERELRRFPIPGNRYYGWSSLVFSEGGNHLVWTGNVVTSHVACIWDVHSGKTVHSIEKKQQLGCDGALIFSPDFQTYTVTGFKDNSFQLLETATGKLIHRFLGHESRVAPVAFSPDGMSLASGSYDKTVRIWEIATGKERQCFHGHRQRVTCLAYSPDGRTVASASGDNTIRLWDIVTGKECRRFEGHRGGVTCLAFSPDGQLLVSGSDDTTALVWDLRRPPNRKRSEVSLSAKEWESRHTKRDTN